MNFNSKKIEKRQINKHPQLNYIGVSRKINVISVWLLLLALIFSCLATVNFHKEAFRKRSTYFITTTGKTVPLSFTETTKVAINHQIKVLNDE